MEFVQGFRGEGGRGRRKEGRRQGVRGRRLLPAIG
jgi:hypothetical protein